MPRNMSCFHTRDQVRNKSKDVTRRLGWAKLKPGEMFCMVEKAMGLKRGEKVVKIAVCRCVSNRNERLNEITCADVVREGFPGMMPAEFVEMFCQHMGCEPEQIVNRIEFEYVEEQS